MRKWFVAVVFFLLMSMIVLADGEVDESAEIDEYGFSTSDYNSVRVNDLTPEQLYAAIVQGRVTNYAVIADSNLQTVVMNNPSLWDNAELVVNINTRVQNDVSFLNDNAPFKSAWFNTHQIVCADCSIGGYSVATGEIRTIDAQDLKKGESASEQVSVVKFKLQDFPGVEILADGSVRYKDGNVVKSAALVLDKTNNIVTLSPLIHSDSPEQMPSIVLSDVESDYIYHVLGGRVILAQDIFFQSKDTLLHLDGTGKYTVASPSLQPAELRFIQTLKKGATREIISYAFRGEISFKKDDLVLEKEADKLNNLRLSHVSLAADTNYYDFTTGNVVAVTKPTEYFHRDTAVVLLTEENLQCQPGRNCIEYYLDRERLGGVMHVESHDNNEIKINVVNLDTRKNVKYKTFQEKREKEIDLELAYLQVGTMTDDSKVIVNDNGVVVFEFSKNAPLIKGKLTDKTISTIETSYVDEQLLTNELVSDLAEDVQRSSLQKIVINEENELEYCTDENCRQRGRFTSEELELTPLEVTERVYVAAHRYALCSTTTGKCGGSWKTYGFFSTPDNQKVPTHDFFLKKGFPDVQWSTTCIGLTKAALNPNLQEGLETQIQDRVSAGDKYADTGFFVQEYLREKVPGFTSTYILVQEHPGYKETDTSDEESLALMINEERVRQLVERKMKEGEQINVIIVPRTEDRTKILERIPRGSLVTQPVLGHDYVYAGIDSLTGEPTAYEAHVSASRPELGITRDPNGITYEAILITYPQSSAPIDYTDIYKKGTVYFYNPQTGQIEFRGIPESKDRTKAAELLQQKRELARISGVLSN